MEINRIVACVCENGEISLIQEPTPELKTGWVLVRSHASLVSPGTELGGWRNLFSKRGAHSNPDPRKFGYSSAGVIEALGEGVTQFQVGERVACIGYGFALHSDYAVVPQNLCVHLPDLVSFEQGSYSMLLATALQAVRRANPEIGERAAVVGMGLVGQLSAQLLQLSGVSVIGWARNGMQVDVANAWGVDRVLNMKTQDSVDLTCGFTKGQGLDMSVFAFPGSAGDTWQKNCDCMQKSPDGHLMGRVVVVGGSSICLKWIPANIDIRIAARTGPGYHDDDWETGRDYPSVFMRWTTRTNLEVCMDLIARGKINLDVLTTHRAQLMNATSSINEIRDPDSILGLVFVS